MQTWRPQDALLQRLHRQARADRWAVSSQSFADALERSARRAFSTQPDASQLERYLASLHLEDLALACACASGHEAAWEHFVRELRPTLYRAADAIDPTGGARDLADSLYGELFGLTERDGERRSHFEYFHGRSSLATWLRAVLAQRHVDRLRTTRRFDPLPADDAAGAQSSSVEPDGLLRPDHGALLRRVFAEVVGRLAPRDRLRLCCYYAQDLTLAQTGRALGEHEATVSRHLARTRREIRHAVERHLRDRERMNDATIAECFAAMVDDAGSLEMADLLGPDTNRKEARGRRSKERAEGASA